MSTRIGDLAIVISANTTDLARGLARGSAMVGGFAGSVARRMGDVGRSIRDAFGGAGGVAAGTLIAGGIRSAAGGMRDLVTSSLDLAKAAEVSSVKFEAMLGSAQKAAALQKDLKDFAAASPVSLAAANESGVRLLSAGIDQQQIAPTLRALTEIAGGDPAAMKDAVRAYTQVASTGRLQGDEWNQFANLGTLNYGDLAKVLKHDGGRQVEASEVKGLIEKGKVSFEDLGNAIKKATEEGGRFYGLTARYSDTYAGRLDKLTDAWDETKREFGKGIMEGLDLKGTVSDVTKMVEKAREFGTAIGGVAKLIKNIALPVAGAIADATSALYRAGQTAALWVRGELDTYRKGEAAKAALIASEERAQDNMGRFGLSRPDAFSLGDYQDAAAKAFAEQESARKGVNMFREAMAKPGNAEYRERYEIKIREEESALKAAAGERAKADAMVASILRRGDPTKIAFDKDGRPYVPKRSDFPQHLADLGTRLNERFADPVKKFQDDLRDLTRLKNAGRLDPSVYEAAAVDLKRGLEERAGMGGGPPRLAPAAELGSQQLANLVGQAMQGGGGPQSVEGLLKQLAEINRQQLDAAKLIVAGVTGKPPVLTMPE